MGVCEQVGRRIDRGTWWRRVRIAVSILEQLSRHNHLHDLVGACAHAERDAHTHNKKRKSHRQQRMSAEMGDTARRRGRTQR